MTPRRGRAGGVGPLFLVALLLTDFSLSSARADLPDLERRYGIQVLVVRDAFDVPGADRRITGRPAGDTLPTYLRLFEPEFSLFPPALVKAARLKRVVICTRLAYAGQLRAAIPDFGNDTLYLDADRGGPGSAYQRTVLHHEFFHVIDYRDDGLVYRDDAWATLNPPAFRYGAGGRNAQSVANTAMLTDRYPGFLTHYATTGVEEDKGETFAYLLLHPAEMRSRTATDPVLAAKAARMKELLAAFCPAVDAGFWTTVDEFRSPPVEMVWTGRPSASPARGRVFWPRRGR